MMPAQRHHGQRVFAFEDAAVETGQQDVFHQAVDTPHVAVHQAQFGQPRQLAAQELRRFRQLLHQQTLQGAAMLELGFGRRREAPFLDRAASSTSAGYTVIDSPAIFCWVFSATAANTLAHRLLAFRRLRDGQRGLAGFGESAR
jgi:hypothetical protein